MGLNKAVETVAINDFLMLAWNLDQRLFTVFM